MSINLNFGIPRHPRSPKKNGLPLPIYLKSKNAFRGFNAIFIQSRDKQRRLIPIIFNVPDIADMNLLGI